MALVKHESDVGKNTLSAGTSISATLPTNIAAGDLLRADVETVFDQTISTPAGWNLIAQVGDGNGATRVASFYRSPATADANDNATFSLGASCDAVVICNRFSGHDPTTPIHTSATNTATTGSNTAITCPSVTTSVPNTIIDRVGATRDSTANLTTPGSHTPSGSDNTGTGAADAVLASAYIAQAGTGASGTADFVATTGNREWTAITVAIAPAPAPKLALYGTIIPQNTDRDVKAGGRTIILELVGDTWAAAGATFDGERQNIINALDSAQSEAGGWDAKVKATEVVGAVVRTSNTVVTITLTAAADYSITAPETISVTIPASATAAGTAPANIPSFVIGLGQAHRRYS